MSATTELLVEQIKEVEEAIVAARAEGRDPSSLERTLAELRKRFEVSVQALNEGKQILKS